MSVKINPIKERPQKSIFKENVLEDIYDIMANMRILDVLGQEIDKAQKDRAKTRSKDKKAYISLVLEQLFDDKERLNNKIQKIIDKYD